MTLLLFSKVFHFAAPKSPKQAPSGDEGGGWIPSRSHVHCKVKSISPSPSPSRAWDHAPSHWLAGAYFPSHAVEASRCKPVTKPGPTHVNTPVSSFKSVKASMPKSMFNWSIERAWESGSIEKAWVNEKVWLTASTLIHPKGVLSC